MKYLLIILFFTSCDKIVEIPDNNSFIQNSDLKENDNLLISYVNSIYNDIYYIYNSGENFSPLNNLSFFLGALSDEYKAAIDVSANNLVRNSFFNNYYEINLQKYQITDLFVPYYKVIINCNNALEILSSKNNENFYDLYLEIRAIRSFIYYLLVQLYGDVPLLVSSDLNINIQIPRTNKNDIVNFCINELESIYSIIKNEKLNIDFSNVIGNYSQRVNKDIVSYHLSMLYLLDKNYDMSIKHSLDLIKKYSFNVDYEKKFEILSTENIWILNPSFPTIRAIFNNASASIMNYKLIPTVTPFNSTRPFALSGKLLDIFNYNDKRRKYFIDSVFFGGDWNFLPYKYKVQGNFDLNSKERFIVIRLSTVYFNLIEAFFLSNNKEKAIEYYNIICKNNFFSHDSVIDISMEDILNERFKELFSENGDRWFSLKRTGFLDSVMLEYLPVKSNGLYFWESTMEYLPIPLDQVLLNPILK